VDVTEPGVAVVAAPAKLTVSLRVTARRDDGYHLIDAEMVTLDLADRLEITPGDGLEVVASETGLRVEGGDDNSVRRALAAVGRTAQVRLVKRIPAGGGLGGASADAAAVLRWAGVDDLAVAASIGADVPFCLRGGRARVRGIGDLVEPLPFEARTYTLLIPPFGCSTPEVYGAWDRLGGPRDEGPNDLAPAALHVEPRLATWRDRLAAATGQVPVLAGSGSTWFVAGAFPGEGRIVAQTRPAEVLAAGNFDDRPSDRGAPERR
jgi:4-diphosphocytidyl-2-C-methyl-D-erythritol kinase